MSARIETGPGKIATTLGALLFGFALPYLVPALARFEVIRPGSLEKALSPRVPVVQWTTEELSIPERRRARIVRRTLPELKENVPAPRPRGHAAPAGPGTDIEGVEALVAFYEKLDRTRQGVAGAITRISHFGDSPLTGDLISGEARKRLQDRFGDAGHGFLLPGRPWGWYGHLGVSLKDGGWKKLSPLFGNGNGGRLGLSGVAFTSGSGKATTSIETEGRFSRIQVSYGKRPGGGRFVVTVDDGPAHEVATAADARSSAVESIDVDEGKHEVSIQTKGDGEVTLYGVVLERSGPGIVYDALGANGASVHFLSLLDAGAWEEALAQRKSDLVILGYGTNESGYWGIPGPRYEREYGEIIARVKRALPQASILIMAPMDRGMRDESGAIVTMPKIPEIVEAQRKVARENGCAFFDTFAAVGGAGTMGRWYDAEPRLVTGDFTHTTKTGSDRVARLLVEALEAGYVGGRPAPSPTPAPVAVSDSAPSAVPVPE